jgi:hypothetical protein
VTESETFCTPAVGGQVSKRSEKWHRPVDEAVKMNIDGAFSEEEDSVAGVL